MDNKKLLDKYLLGNQKITKKNYNKKKTKKIIKKYKSIEIMQKYNLDTKIDEKNIEIKQNSNTKRFLISIFLILILLLLPICGSLYLYNMNHKVVIKKSINHLLSYKNYINFPIYLEHSNKKSLKGNINFKTNDKYKNLYNKNDSNYKFYDLINKLNIQYDFEKDNNNSFFDLTLNNSGLMFIANKDSNYIYLKNVYDKYIKINKINNIYNNSDEDYKYLYNFCYDSFFKHMNKSNYKSEKTNIVLNEKNQIVNKTSIKISQKEIIDILNMIIKDIKSDKKANEIITNITGTKIKKIKNNENIYNFEYNVYTKGLMSNIVGIDFNINKKYKSYKYSWDDLTNNSYNSKKYAYKNNKISFIYRNDNKPILSFYKNNKIKNRIEISKHDNTQIFINVYNDDNDNISSIKLLNKKDKYMIEIKRFDDLQESTYKINFNINENRPNNDYNIKFSGNFHVVDAFYDTESTDLYTSGSFNIKNDINNKIKKINNSINLDNISNEDIKKIVSTIMTNYLKYTDYHTGYKLPSLIKYHR